MAVNDAHWSKGTRNRPDIALLHGYAEKNVGFGNVNPWPCKGWRVGVLKAFPTSSSAVKFANHHLNNKLNIYPDLMVSSSVGCTCRTSGLAFHNLGKRLAEKMNLRPPNSNLTPGPRPACISFPCKKPANKTNLTPPASVPEYSGLYKGSSKSQGQTGRSPSDGEISINSCCGIHAQNTEEKLEPEQN